MRILVTGGSGVIGEGLVPELLQRGHQIRLLARGADEAVRKWPAGVEPFAADVTHPEQLLGAADGCDAIVHITGIVDEQPPDLTFDRVNVGGTRNLLVEAARGGLPKFVFISSLAAERGSSAYHASKREAEALVREYAGRWVILRPGNVYGPGDDVISQLLNMLRTLPAIPVIGAGDYEFQPIWYADVGKAIAEAVERDVPPQAYQIAGVELTTPNEVLNRLERLTGRSPLRVPVPEWLAGVGTRAAQAVGVALPINESQLLMLLEHNVVTPPEHNALVQVFDVDPTPLDVGLAVLADAQPEQAPNEGVGGMERKRFWAEISGSRFDAEGLMAVFRQRCTEILPIEFEVEPGAPTEVAEGVTLTAALPLRGNIQIRVQQVTPHVITFATLRGHPLAGVVRFSAADRGPGAVEFTVMVFARAATVFDWVALSTVGGAAQNATWRTVVERMIELSGGESPGVQQETETVRGAASAQIDDWIVDLITSRQRVEHARHLSSS